MFNKVKKRENLKICFEGEFPPPLPFSRVKGKMFRSVQLGLYHAREGEQGLDCSIYRWKGIDRVV